MTRALGGAFATAITQPHVNLFPLLEIQFASGTDYICGLAHDVTYGGNTYLAAGACLGIDPITETANTAEGLRISLAGSRSADVSLVLSEKIQGRIIKVRLAVIDAGTVVADENVWTGLGDTMTLQDDADSCVIALTAEHMLSVWDRPRVVRYTDAQQQKLFAGDLGLQYIEDMAEAQIVWPGKEFFQV